MKSVLITGSEGLAGATLVRHLASKARVRALSHAQLDIADSEAVRKMVAEIRPDLIFNCAAYTRVDDAEKEPQKARRANVQGPQMLAQALNESGGRLVHLSTDYVFDGQGRAPYRTEDAVGPLGIYAQTKAEGEKAVLGSGSRHLVVRVAWLFRTGGRTFLSRLKDLLLSSERLQAADDREGPCTYAPDLAAGLWDLAEGGAEGIYHFTNEGSCSWFSFAEALLAEARRLGLPVRTGLLERTDSASFSPRALRPEYSVLDLSKTVTLLGRTPRPWQATLKDFLLESG